MLAAYVGSESSLDRRIQNNAATKRLHPFFFQKTSLNFAVSTPLKTYTGTQKNKNSCLLLALSPDNPKATEPIILQLIIENLQNCKRAGNGKNCERTRKTSYTF